MVVKMILRMMMTTVMVSVIERINVSSRPVQQIKAVILGVLILMETAGQI